MEIIQDIISNIKRKSVLQRDKEDIAILNHPIGNVNDDAIDFKEYVQSIDNAIRHTLKRIGLVYSDDEITMETINGLQWIIYGDNVDIRSMKSRLNQALIMFDRIRRLGLVEDENIFLKCAVAVYLKNEFEKDFYSLSYGDMQYILDDYISNREAYLTQLGLTDKFANQIRTLVEKRLIDLNYRCYFYNMPLDSKKYNSDEMKVYSAIVYGETPYNEKDFFNLIESVDEKVILDAYTKRVELGIGLPEFIVSTNKTLKIAYERFKDSFYELICNQQYDVNNLHSINEFLQLVLAYKTDYNSRHEYLNLVVSCLLSSIADKNVLIEIRKDICKNHRDEIMDFKDMFLNENPIISPEEIRWIDNPRKTIELMNFDNDIIGMGIASIEILHENIISDLEVSYEDSFEFYNNLIIVIGISDSHNMILDWLGKYKIFPEAFNVFYQNGIDDGIIQKSDFVKALELCEKIQDSSLQLFSDIEWNRDISEKLGRILWERSFVIDYLIGELLRDNKVIDYSDTSIKQCILENIEYLRDNVSAAYRELRRDILKQSKYDYDYSLIFQGDDKLEADELIQIKDYKVAIDLLKKQNDLKQCIDYLAGYFSNCKRNTTETYEIIQYIISLPRDIAYKVFYSLNMENMSYTSMSKKRKEELNAKLITIFGVAKSVDEKIKILRFTHCPMIELEKNIVEELDENNESLYIDYINTLNSVNEVQLTNILKLKTIYIYSDVSGGTL